MKARAPLLPPFIIEQIRRREDAERCHRERQPRLELPLDAYQPIPLDSDPKPSDRPNRGVIIVDLMGGD